MKTTSEYHTRLFPICPLCRGTKQQGLVTCWSCYREHDLRNGNEMAEHIIAEFEATLIAELRR